MFPLHDVRKTSAQGKKPHANSLCNGRTGCFARSVRRSQTSGGARRDRTDDLMLAKHALSQLSYGPVRRGNITSTWPLSQNRRRKTSRDGVVGLGRLELPTSRLSSARSNQLSYKPEPFASRRGLLRPSAQAGKSYKRCRSGLHGLVREERETKAAKSRKWSL